MQVATKKTIGSFLIFSFTLMSCLLYHTDKGYVLKPDQKPGAKIKVQLKNGQNIEGELIAVKHNSLLLLSDEGADVAIDIKDVKTLIVVKKTQVAIILVLASAGLLSVLSEEDRNQQLIDFTESFYNIAPICAGVGVLIGLVAGLDNRIYVSTKSDSEIQEILIKLRKRARVKNFQ